MSKTVQSVKNSLKFKVSPKSGALYVKIGATKCELPVQVRVHSAGGFVFLSYTASSDLYKMEGKNLVALGESEDATAAFEALNAVAGKKRGRKRTRPELPTELAELLKSLPSGTKIGYSADGTPKLIKTRPRGKK